MNDTTVGYLLLATGIVFVLGLVFALSSRQGRTAPAPGPMPRGVHLPNPSLLPALFAVAGALIGVGLVFAPEGAAVNWFVFGPGLLLLLASAITWVRDAGHEWHETENRAHDDVAEH